MRTLKQKYADDSNNDNNNDDDDEGIMYLGTDSVKLFYPCGVNGPSDSYFMHQHAGLKLIML